MQVLIQMYYDDHNPAHSHAIYGEYKAVRSTLCFSILKKHAISTIIK
jgi:hypothetical protein